MGYLHLADNDFVEAYSKAESVKILDRYADELSKQEYDTIYYSLSSHALENIYLNERDILLSIAQLRHEITLDQITELARAS